MYILDSGAFFSLPTMLQGDLRTTNLVIEEVKKPLERMAVDEMLRRKTLQIEDPPSTYIRLAKEEASKIGELHKLSNTDISLLALSLYLSESGKKVTILTDDFALQNVAVNCGMNVKSTSGKRIIHKIVWEFYCPACRSIVKEGIKFCSSCGSKIKRRPKLKKAV